MKKLDKLIFILTLVLSSLSIVFSGSLFKSDAGQTAVIEIDGEIYGKYDLESEKSDSVLEIKTKYGYNKVVIDKNGICVLESSCKDKLEVLGGYIKNAGEMLVCLPNRLVILIEGEREVDGVAY